MSRPGITSITKPALVLALLVIGSTATHARDSVPALIAALKDANAEVRRDAAHTLGCKDAESQGIMVMPERPPKGRIRTWPWPHRSPTVAAVPALKKALKDENAAVRIAATQALLQIDPQAALIAPGP